MTQFLPEPVVIDDERSKAILFALIKCNVSDVPQFEFADMLRLWFNNDAERLARFLEWLDVHGLEIRKKP